MGKSLVKGCLFGGIIVFVWMMVSWMLIPWHCWTLNSFEDESAVAQVFIENTNEDGVYVLPNFCDKVGTELDESMAAMKRGPFAFVSVQRAGHSYDSAGPFISSLIIQFVGALIITYLILQMVRHTYWMRVWFVTLIGFLIGFLTDLPNWNWWGFSINYVLLEMADLVIGWFFAGLAIAAVTGGKKRQTS